MISVHRSSRSGTGNAPDADIEAPIRDALHVPNEHWSFDIPRPVVSVGVELTLTEMAESETHSHRQAQLILALSGLVTCEVDNCAWIVPAQRAIWIPGETPHKLKASGKLKIVSLFFESAAQMPADCCTVSVTPLLRELLVQASKLPVLYDMDGPEGRLITVLLDQLAIAPHENLHIPMPRDARLCRISKAILAAPAERFTIAEWGSRVGASERTLARLLRNETGMSFGRWQRQLHVLLALQLLAEGHAVQLVAQDLGYESASAFITMFRKCLGKSPARYLSDRQRDISTHHD